MKAMSDLENVLRRLARLLQSAEQSRDGARVADDDGAGDETRRADRPATRSESEPNRDVPQQGAAAT